MIRLVIALVFVLIAVISSIAGMIFLLRWYSHIKEKNQKLLKELQSNSVIGKFLDPKKFFPYCFKEEKDEVAQSFKRRYIAFMALWLASFLIAFIAYKL